jgi:cytochrome c oxidase subunit 3
MHDIPKPAHDFHLVNPSPWPIATAFSLLILAIGAICLFHHYAIYKLFLPLGCVLVGYCVFSWWSDVLQEGREEGAHTPIVQHGLKIAMAIFILSEMMFFLCFFSAFFKASLDPVHLLDGVWATKLSTWPPAGIKPFDPWDIPFLNTLILLLSGTTVTWAHHSIFENNKKDLVLALTLTVALGFAFSCMQALEYFHAPFSFKSGIYASNFYLATGFHGVHVLVGTLFLAVNLFRAKRGHFDPEHNHLGFEFAAWYWHFVDVVWLFLFVFVYVWGR